MAEDYVAATRFLDLLTVGRIELEACCNLFALIESTMDDDGILALLPALGDVINFWDALRRLAAR